MDGGAAIPGHGASTPATAGATRNGPAAASSEGDSPTQLLALLLPKLEGVIDASDPMLAKVRAAAGLGGSRGASPEETSRVTTAEAAHKEVVEARQKLAAIENDYHKSARRVERLRGDIEKLQAELAEGEEVLGRLEGRRKAAASDFVAIQ
eukprot:1150628-Alexandrium_andersonii.AAC.1